MSILEEIGSMHHITKEVQDGPEIAAVVWEANERFATDGPGLIFEHVHGYDIPVVKNLYGSYRHLALALGLPNWEQATFRDMREYVAPRLESKEHWQKPVILPEGPSQEVVLTGADATFDRFPILKWHHWDGGPYITFGATLNKDPQWGYNLGVYRTMKKSSTTVTIMAGQMQDLGIYAARALKRGETEIDTAIVIGAPPSVTVASAMKMPSVKDSEYEFAAALSGQPVPLVRCKTVDLEVPAYAEIVFEGKLRLTDTQYEGPFGEVRGTTEEGVESPTFHLTAVTHRRNPFYVSITSGHMHGESLIVNSMRVANAYNTLKDTVVGFRDAAFPLEGRGFIAVVSIAKRYPGWGKQAIMATQSAGFAMANVTTVIVVDEDVDVFDWAQVTSAIAWRVDPELDVMIFPAMAGGAILTAARRKIREWTPTGPQDYSICSRMGIDATRRMPHEGVETVAFQKPSTPDPEVMKQVAENWASYGFPSTKNTPGKR
jgi:UbiD family decarboxylase